MSQSHSEISPSKAHRVIGCPGSINMCRGIPDKTNIFAEEGTAAHGIAEYCLAADYPPKNIKNPVKEFPKWGKWCDKPMKSHLQTYYDLVKGDLTDDSLLRVEIEVDLGWVHPGVKGWADAIVGEEMGLLRVYDLKYGAGVRVDPDNNSQQMLYALGVIGEDNPMMYDEVELIIFQPRYESQDPTIRRWRCSVEHLYEFAEKFRAACKLTESKHAERHAGEWCQFCNAMAVCPELVLAAANSAQVQFDALDEPEEIAQRTKSDKLPAIDRMHPNQIGHVLGMAKVFNKWLEEVKKYAVQEMLEGTNIPGIKLVKKKRFRKWLNPAEAAEDLEMLYGPEVYSLKSVYKLEKLPDVNPSDIRHLWYQDFDKLPIREDDLTVAPVWDRRKRIYPSQIEDDFEDLNAGEQIIEEDDFL